jgi:hypothetical protein
MKGFQRRNKGLGNLHQKTSIEKGQLSIEDNAIFAMASLGLTRD